MEENGSGFTTFGNQIYDPDGNPFTARGVNIFPWHGGPSSIDKITGCWGFNLVRLHAWILPYDTGQWKDHVVYVEDPVFYNPEQISYRVYDVAGLIDAYASQGIVVVFDVHDKIGRYFEGQELSDYLTFITHFADKYKDNSYVWLDIHNEPGTYDGRNLDFTKWRSEMSTILDTVRTIAPDMMMMVSGAAWGQDTGPNWNSQFIQPQQSALLANADIINSYDNVIATFHMYDQWVYGGLPRLANFVDQLNMTLDKPVIVGEYGSYNNRDTVIASENLHHLIGVSGYGNIGRIVWNWNGRDLNDLTTSDYGGGEQADSCTTPTNLTALGNLVWNDNHIY
jgi:mannan endo-1,4-beta-mannosidase